MVDTATSEARLRLIGEYEQEDAWGPLVNDNFSIISRLTGAYGEVAIIDGVNAFSVSDYTLDEWHYHGWNITGALTAPASLEVPNYGKHWIAHDNTTGGQTVTILVSGQTGVALPSGGWAYLYNNGTDVVKIFDSDDYQAAGSYQPLDADLTALAALASTGILARTASDTYTERSIEVGSGLTVADGDGVAGNPTVSLDTELAAIAAFASTGILVRTGSGAYSFRSVAAGDGITVSNGDGTGGNPTVTLNITGLTDESTVVDADSIAFYDNDAAALREATIADLFASTHTIWVPASAMASPTTNGAADGDAELATNDIQMKTKDFDASTDEKAQFSIGMPTSWDEGTVTCQFYWQHPSTTTNFDVVWACRAVAFGNSDALDAAFGTAQTVTDTGGTTEDLFISSATSAITIAGTPASGDMVIFEIYRDADNGSDNLAVDAKLLGVKILYTINSKSDA